MEPLKHEYMYCLILIHFQVIKYCPICVFKTENNLLRHLVDRHSDELVAPAHGSAKQICKYLASKSRSLINVIPIRVMKDAIGQFWDDRSIRATCYK